MKGKFHAFGFLTGFMDVPRPRYGDRIHFPIWQRAFTVPTNPNDIFEDKTAVTKQVTFECRGFDDDKAAIFELVEF